MTETGVPLVDAAAPALAEPPPDDPVGWVEVLALLLLLLHAATNTSARPAQTVTLRTRLQDVAKRLPDDFTCALPTNTSALSESAKDLVASTILPR